MGSFISFLSRKKSRQVRQEIVRLETRIDRMVKETAKLKEEIRTMIQSKETAVIVENRKFAWRIHQQYLLPTCKYC